MEDDVVQCTCCLLLGLRRTEENKNKKKKKPAKVTTISFTLLERDVKKVVLCASPGQKALSKKSKRVKSPVEKGVEEEANQGDEKKGER